MNAKKIAIIGGGAAGCFAAANIENQEVVLFEKTGKILQKVKASGGGRCNVTHACFDIDELVTNYPRGKQLLRKSLYRFTPNDTIEWFERRGVHLKTEADGRIFPVTDSSQTIIDSICQQMMHNKVPVKYHKAIEKIEKLETGFQINFADRSDYTTDKILVATGGFPKAEQYKWLLALGHTFQSPVPSLFTFNIPKHPVTALMGISVPEATIKIGKSKILEKGPLLITHWGLSGPVVLRASAWAARELNERNYEFEIQVNWLNDLKEQDIKENIQMLRKYSGRQQVWGKNQFNLPKRLWEYQLQQCGINEDVRWGDLLAGPQYKLTEKLIGDAYEVRGKTTYKEEFVTCGGITLSEIHPQTMESRIVPGLYFAGEIMDVDGITGGYNFQHAWSSAYIAACSMTDI